jgi:hypothetical protein
MSVNGKFKDFEEHDLLAEADRFAIGTAPRVIETVRAAVQAWPSFAAQAAVPRPEIERITVQLLPLAAPAPAKRRAVRS